MLAPFLKSALCFSILYYLKLSSERFLVSITRVLVVLPVKMIPSHYYASKEYKVCLSTLSACRGYIRSDGTGPATPFIVDLNALSLQ